MKQLLIPLTLVVSLTTYSQEQWLSKNSSQVIEGMKTVQAMMVEESYSSDGDHSFAYYFSDSRLYLTFKFDSNDKCNRAELIAKDDFGAKFQKTVIDHCNQSGYKVLKVNKQWTGKIYDYTHFQISVLNQEKFDTKIIYELL